MANSAIKIIESAIPLFKLHGYNATTILNISTSAGMLKGSLYNHFKSKEDLLIHVIDHVESGFFKRIQLNESTDFEVILDNITDFYIEHDITCFFKNWEIQLANNMDSKIPKDKRLQFAEDIIIGFEGSILVNNINNNHNAISRYLKFFKSEYKRLQVEA